MYHNKSSFIQDFQYKDLYEIVCSKCRNKWLICAIHSHRWSQLRYRLAENHVKSAHQNISNTSINSLSSDIICLPATEDSTESNDFNSHDEASLNITSVDDYSVPDLSSYSLPIQNFIKCHRPIFFG